MKLYKPAVAILAIALLLCTIVTLAEPVESHPGFVSLTSESLATGDLAPAVEINLTPPLLRLATATALGAADAAAGENPEAAQLKDFLDSVNLHLVQIRVFENIEVNKNVIESGNERVDALIADGWTSIVRVPEDNVNILLRTDDTHIRGAFISVIEPDEMVFVNVIADIDPEEQGQQIGQLLGKAMSGQFDPAQLQQMLAGITGGGAPPPQDSQAAEHEKQKQEMKRLEMKKQEMKKREHELQEQAKAQ